MKAVGVVVEYNPFHNGHLYHLNKVREMYPNHIVIAIMSGNYMQRGQVSLISKWDKTKLALYYGVDIVLDLPFVLANESADYFAHNSIKILNHFKVEKVVFGCESSDVSLYYKLANIQLNSQEYNEYVKQNMLDGLNYPTACSKALAMIGEREINLPNDILGLAYTKTIIENNYDMDIDVVKRTNDFHSTTIEKIASATSIRNALLNNNDFKIAVPSYTYEILTSTKITSNDDIFNFLKYKIISSSANELALIHLIDEGLEYKIKKSIYKVNDFDSLVKEIASKRYTYSRVSRILLNILVNYTKEERNLISSLNYNRVLGFSKVGQKYLKYLKKLDVSYDVNIKTVKNTISDIEYRASQIYTLINSEYNENEKIVSL